MEGSNDRALGNTGGSFSDMTGDRTSAVSEGGSWRRLEKFGLVKECSEVAEHKKGHKPSQLGTTGDFLMRVK